MKSSDYPQTSAVRYLTAQRVPFVPHFYRYEAHGGTQHAAQSLGIAEHVVIKTLVMQTHARKPLIVLMHGNCEVSVKQLARVLNVKQVAPCPPAIAQKYTGYQVGGISPFGTRQVFPVYAETSIFEVDKIYINGGKRGFLVEIDSRFLETLLPITRVEVAIRTY